MSVATNSVAALPPPCVCISSPTRRPSHQCETAGSRAGVNATAAVRFDGRGRKWRAIRAHADDRQHTRQGAPLRKRGKRGEQKQAVGRSRGGRNTKIHALSDAKGRLIALLLTGGEAHDCPVAERLIKRAKTP